MGVSNGDVVQIWLNYTYWDNRSSGSRSAVHDFNVSAVHNGVTVWNNPSHTTTGNPPGGGGANINVGVGITDDTLTIAITWKAKVTITPGCSATSTTTHTIYLS
jgi:hypothetical protein